MAIIENSYVFVSDNIVLGTVTLDPEAPSYPRKKAGFDNTTGIIDITDNEEARIGSTWDGTSFTHDDSEPAHIVEGQHRFAFISDNKIFYIKRVMYVSTGTVQAFIKAAAEGISVYPVTSETLPETGSAWS
jgi:hypothetical protein